VCNLIYYKWFTMSTKNPRESDFEEYKKGIGER